MTKNLSPLRLKGRWLAVIMIEPSNSKPGVMVDMNMAGVDARPVSNSETPISTAAFFTASRIRGPVMRESRPTPTRSAAGALPKRAPSQVKKPQESS